MSGWSAFEALLIGLQTNVTSLSSDTVWDTFGVTSSDSSVVSAVASESAQAGKYSLQVDKIAQNHQMAFGSYSTLSQSISAGTLNIKVGNEDHTINITSSNNTVQGMINAVNDADIGVTASALKMSGNYKIVFSSDETGIENKMLARFTPTSGTAQGFDTISTTTTGWTGATVSSAGVYTGYSDKAYTVSATSSGTVGTDPLSLHWVSGSESGDITVAADYHAGDAITLADGVTFSLAAGSVTSGESFGVAVDAASIQAPQDAEIMLGSGDNALLITSDTNSVDGIVPGVTLNLLSASPDKTINITVQRDSQTIINKVQAMVTAYNKVVDFTNQQQKYDQETMTSGVLFGDSTFSSIDMNLKGKFSGYLDSTRGLYQAFGDIGISMNDDATLTLDTTVLSDALSGNYSDVKKLFLNTGETTDTDINFISANDSTSVTTDGYAVNITRAAEQASYRGSEISLSSSSPLVISSSNKNLQFSFDGVRLSNTIIPEGTYTSGSALATAIQDAVNQDDLLHDKIISVEWVDTTPGKGYFKITSPSYGSNSNVTVEAANGNLRLGLAVGSDNGVDVAGTINGETAEGTGRLLRGVTGNKTTSGLSLEVLLTPAQLSAQGSAQGSVYYTTGLMTSIDSFMSDLTNSLNGVLKEQQKSLKTMYDDLQTEVVKYDEKIEAKRLELELKFNNMETILNQLNSQGNYLAAQIAGLSTTSSS